MVVVSEGLLEIETGELYTCQRKRFIKRVNVTLIPQ